MIGQDEDDGLDEEERAHLAQVKAEQDERLRQLRERQSEEMAQKRERQEAGQRALNEWYAQRSTQIESRKSANKEKEWAYLQLREEHKKSKNPWEKIIDNCEMGNSKYAGSADVSRLRQAMISRKGDLGRISSETTE